MGLKTWDPSQLNLIVGGSIINSWNTVSIDLDEDEQTSSTGTSGESTRSINASKMGTATLTLPQASDDNATLSALAEAKSIFSLSTIDKSGKSIHVMSQAFISKRAASEYTKESGEREWVIKGDLDVHLPAGNN